MVLIRDVSHAVRIDGEARVVASLILDADTGLARGMSVGRSEGESCSQAMRIALTRPAGALPPRRPSRVLCGVGYQNEVATELRNALRGAKVPAVTEVISVEAEDIFDSFVGQMSGRRQPEEFAAPADWQILFEQAADYAQAQPWLRWADDIRMDVVVRIDGVATRYIAVVIGHEGIQRGLVLYPGGVLPADLQDWQPGAPTLLPAGTLVCYLDPPDQAPPEFAAKAERYGWPADAALIPVWLVAGPDGTGDLDQLDVHRLTLALAAVVAHDRSRPAVRKTGEIVLAGGRRGTYSIG